MKTKRIIIFTLAILLGTFFAAGLTAEEDSSNKDQPKITTPPLQLTEEEETRGTADTTPKPVMGGTVEAKTPVQEELGFEPKHIRANTKIELILDASGSMNGLMGTSTKMDMLKSAVNDAVSQPLPEDAEREVGLRVYGSKSASDKGDCNDTELLLPIEPIAIEAFATKVGQITAMGVTPIGQALEKAAENFEVTDKTDNVVILVSDGADSCKANVCDIATALHNDPKKIMINVIGFDVDQKASTSLECIAKNSDGKYMVARSEDELRSALDQLLMSNIPYNLRIRILSGATPLKSTLKVYRSGTKNMIREDETSGTKYYQLPPGRYDIEIIYSGSLESPPPSKILKGVEVQTTSKAEQIVKFDLGRMTLSAFDQNGAPIGATYILQKKEDPNVLVTFVSEATPYTAWLTDGTYSARVQAVTPEGLKLMATLDSLTIDKETALVYEFKFQVGKIQLTAKNKNAEPLPFTYKVTVEESKEKQEKEGVKFKTVLEGSSEKEGKILDLPPGKYNIGVSLLVPGLKDLPAVQLDEIEIEGGDLIEKTVELPTSTLTLIGKDSNNQPINSTFTINVTDSNEKPIELNSPKEPVVIVLPPARFDIKVLYTDSEYSPPPAINWEGFLIPENKDVEKEAVFKFGDLKLFGKNSKGAPMNSAFYIYNVGDEEPFLTLSNITSPTDIKVVEGFFDVKAEDLTARSEPKPNVWFHNVEVKSGTPTSRDAVFTYGKLKMICRGPNNVTLICDYNVYTYGKDSPIFRGVTTETWTEFDIPPGSYYVEAGYHDDTDKVLLKKWITFSVADNEMVEQAIRF